MERQAPLFNTLFRGGTFFRSTLSEYVASSPFHLTPVHSAIWKFYLVIAPELRSRDIASFDEWYLVLDSKRREFDAIRLRYLCSRHRGDTPILDSEASLDFESLTGPFQCDIDRLFQDHDFFDQRHPANLPKLIEIRQLLYLHLREHPSIPYKQGFHELAGVIYYLFAQEMCCRDADPRDPYSNVFLEKCVAADVYWVYSALLSFLLDHHCYHGADAVDAIQQHLATIDSDLFRLLTTHRISAAVYMLSWVRVLFSRSLGLTECRPVWSVIFAFFPDFGIVEELAIGHLLLFRDKLKKATSSSDILRTVTQGPTVLGELTDREAAERIRRHALLCLKKPLSDHLAVIADQLDSVLRRWEGEDTLWVLGRLKVCRDACLAVEVSLNGVHPEV
jgi:TBC1 domain family protein 5